MTNQRLWDSHMTHMRTNDRCSSLTSALRKGVAARYRACAADWWVLPLSMRARHINRKVQQSDKQATRVFFWLVRTLSVRFITNALATVVTVTQTMAESLAPQETTGTPSSGKRGNFQIPPSPYIQSLDLWSRGDPSWG